MSISYHIIYCIVVRQLSVMYTTPACWKPMKEHYQQAQFGLVYVVRHTRACTTQYITISYTHTNVCTYVHMYVRIWCDDLKLGHKHVNSSHMLQDSLWLLRPFVCVCCFITNLIYHKCTTHTAIFTFAAVFSSQVDLSVFPCSVFCAKVSPTQGDSPE